MEDEKSLYNENIRVKDAKDILRTKLEKGVNCPCCQQFVKSYRRKITSTMAYGLIMLYEKHGLSEFHLEKSLIESNLIKTVRSDFPKLRYWKLINQLAGKRNDGSSRNGYYQITDHGLQFVKDMIDVEKYIYIYNNTPYKKSSDEFISIKDALGQKFNYDELVNF